MWLIIESYMIGTIPSIRQVEQIEGGGEGYVGGSIFGCPRKIVRSLRPSISGVSGVQMMPHGSGAK